MALTLPTIECKQSADIVELANLAEANQPTYGFKNDCLNEEFAKQQFFISKMPELNEYATNNIYFTEEIKPNKNALESQFLNITKNCQSDATLNNESSKIIIKNEALNQERNFTYSASVKKPNYNAKSTQLLNKEELPLKTLDDSTALEQLENVCSTSLFKMNNLPEIKLKTGTSTKKVHNSKAKNKCSQKLKERKPDAEVKPLHKSYTTTVVDTIDKVLKNRLKKFGIFRSASASTKTALNTPTLTIPQEQTEDNNALETLSLPQYPFEMYAFGQMYTDADSKYMKRRGPLTSIRQEQVLNFIFYSF